jgi:hypothetical protein
MEILVEKRLNGVFGGEGDCKTHIWQVVRMFQEIWVRCQEVEEKTYSHVIGPMSRDEAFKLFDSITGHVDIPGSIGYDVKSIAYIGRGKVVSSIEEATYLVRVMYNSVNKKYFLRLTELEQYTSKDDCEYETREEAANMISIFAKVLK